MDAGEPPLNSSPERQASGRRAYLRLSRVFRALAVGTLTSLIAAAIAGYLGIIGLLPIAQSYMEELKFTQSLLDSAQNMRVERMRPGYLNVLVANLDGDNSDWRNTTHVVNSLVDQFDASDTASPVKVQRAFRVLRLSAAPDTAAATERLAEKGRQQLDRYNADILVWGEVTRGDEENTILRLRFVQRKATSLNHTGKYPLDRTLELPGKFGNDLGSALAAQVVADAAPAYESARLVAPLLDTVYKRLRLLTNNMPKALSPAQRAGILNAFAKVCVRIGDQSNDVSRISEAVAAYRAALLERPRVDDPASWALTQMELGTALELQGWRQGSNDRYEESITAYQNALEVYDRHAYPGNWAHVQNGICVTLRRLGSAKRQSTTLEDAIAACRSALAMADPLLERRRWVTVSGNLAAALAALADVKGSAEALREAVSVLDRTLEVIDRTNEPLNWARAKHDSGWMLTKIGLLERDKSAVKTAIIAIRDAMNEFKSDMLPAYSNTARTTYADALMALGRLEYRSDAETAVPLFSQAEEVYGKLVIETERDEVSATGSAGPMTARKMSGLAWAMIATKSFGPACEKLERARELAPQDEQIWVRSALCLMLLSQTEEANAVLSSRHEQASETKSLQAVIRDDVEFLRELGLNHSMMSEFESKYLKQPQNPPAPDGKGR